MWGAGRLERHNIVEYEDAAEFAAACGRDDMIDCLLTMAEVEWEHEAFFRSKAIGHPFTRLFKMWDVPAEKAAIRAKRAKAA